jgi:hypothetical protein
MERKSLQISSLGRFPTPREKLSITCCTHLLKFMYEWFPIGETLVRIDSTASPKFPSCNFSIETHNHMFRCPNIQRQHITNDCIAQIDNINKKWKVPEQIKNTSQKQLALWITENKEPTTGHAATNPDSIEAIQSQASIGWGHLFKGFCSIELQKVVNLQQDKPLTAFKQLRWTSEIIQCMWDSESEHWKQQNSNKHSHTPAETDAKKREHLLAIARELLFMQTNLPPRYKKMFPPYAKITKKRTRNLETWVNTTQDTVHYLLNVKNLPDDDPNNNPQPETPNHLNTTQLSTGLPTPHSNEASQVSPNITA